MSSAYLRSGFGLCGLLFMTRVWCADVNFGTDIGAVPVKVVNGHLIVQTDIVGVNYQNEASFEISFEYPDALTLHPDQYAWVGMDPEKLKAGEDYKIHILVQPGTKWTIPGREIAIEPSKERIAFQNYMTKVYSFAMGERKLKGTIGIGLLKRYHVTLDIPAGQMIFAQPQAHGQKTMSSSLADIIVNPFEYKNNQIITSFKYADNKAGTLVFGGTEYDTFIDRELARSMNKPAGDVTPAWLADTVEGDKRLDLTRYVALRPKPLADGGNDPVIKTGVNLLEYFRVELDWVNQTMAFFQKKVPQYPQADLEFFQAEVANTADAMQAYLEKHPKVRLSPDAADLLVRWRLREKSSDEQLMAAVKWVMDTSLNNGRKTENVRVYADLFKVIPERSDLTIAASKEALKYSRDSISVTSVYALHNILGEKYLEKGDLTQAWKHFLSSAFMTPDDIMTSLNLARVYDKQGRTRRAYSRYKRVAATKGLDEKIVAEVKAAMDRLRPQLQPDDTLLLTESTGK